VLNTSRILAALVSFALLTGCKTAAVDIAAETAALEARSAALVAAESAKDRDAALAFWAEDAVMHFAGGPAMVGRDALGGVYDQFFAQVRQFSAEGTRVVMAASGDLAYEIGINRAIVIGQQSDLVDVGKYLSVWQKIDGEWYVVAVSATSDAAFLEAVETSPP